MNFDPEKVRRLGWNHVEEAGEGEYVQVADYDQLLDLYHKLAVREAIRPCTHWYSRIEKEETDEAKNCVDNSAGSV